MSLRDQERMAILWRRECVDLLRRGTYKARRWKGGCAYLDVIWTEGVVWGRETKVVACGSEKVASRDTANHGENVLMWVHSSLTSTKFISPEAEKNLYWNFP